MKRSPRFSETERNAYRAANANVVGAKLAMPSRHNGEKHWFPYHVELRGSLRGSIWTPECEAQRWLRETPGLAGWYRIERRREWSEPDPVHAVSLVTSIIPVITFTDEQTAFAFKMRWL